MEMPHIAHEVEAFIRGINDVAMSDIMAAVPLASRAGIAAVLHRNGFQSYWNHPHGMRWKCVDQTKREASTRMAQAREDRDVRENGPRAWRKLPGGGFRRSAVRTGVARRIARRRDSGVKPPPARVPVLADLPRTDLEIGIAAYVEDKKDVTLAEVVEAMFPREPLPDHGQKMKVGQGLRLAGFEAYRETGTQAHAAGRTQRLERWKRVKPISR